MDFFAGIMQNSIFGVAFWSWFIAQALKVIFTLVFERKLNFYRMVGSGGMPSSHSSTVMGLSTAVGLQLGWNSPEYAIAITFAVVVMYDASGVRRAVGKQAIILNSMLDDIYQHKPIEHERLKELVGHTPFEVFVGAILGIVIANFMI